MAEVYTCLVNFIAEYIDNITRNNVTSNYYLISNDIRFRIIPADAEINGGQYVDQTRYLAKYQKIDERKVQTNCVFNASILKNLFGCVEVFGKDSKVCVADLEQENLFQCNKLVFVSTGQSTIASHSFSYFCPKDLNKGNYLLVESVECAEGMPYRFRIVKRKDIEIKLTETMALINYYKRLLNKKEDKDAFRERIWDNRMIRSSSGIYQNIPVIYMAKYYSSKYSLEENYELWKDILEEQTKSIKANLTHQPNYGLIYDLHRGIIFDAIQNYYLKYDR